MSPEEPEPDVYEILDQAIEDVEDVERRLRREEPVEPDRLEAAKARIRQAYTRVEEGRLDDETSS